VASPSVVSEVGRFEQIVELERRYLLQTYQRYPLAIARGKGVFVYDVDGRRYLDFVAGLGVNALGHAHRAIVKVIKPHIGERIYDGAVGSAGFLCESFDYLSKKQGLTTKEVKTLQERTFYGKEKSQQPDYNYQHKDDLFKGDIFTQRFSEDFHVFSRLRCFWQAIRDPGT